MPSADKLGQAPKDFGWAAEFEESQRFELGDCSTSGLSSSEKGFTVMMWIRVWNSPVTS